MADTSGRSDRHPNDATPEGLLATKLYVPRLPQSFVARPRLVEKLEDGLSRGVTLVSAPAGFGKTALVTDWMRHSDRPVAWLSLDTADNDPTRFWRHLAAALDRVRPGIAERVTWLLGPSSNSDALVEGLINEIATGREDIVLVLDDFHAIETEAIHASLGSMLERAPPELGVVIASRADPLLPLGRWRAGGKLSEIRVSELRFETGEAAQMLMETVGFDIDDQSVLALADRTEGWAAGLHLAALSLRDESDLAEFVDTFSGSHRYILDYLTEEVLDQQPTDVRRFLMETAILERLSGPLCDAVTGGDNGQSMLESIEAANLFLLPLDDVRGWWRYHHLFADLLRARVEQQHPQRVEVLHRNAASWHEERGLTDEAFKHALASGDPDRAARMVERHFDQVFPSSEGATAQRWLASLPAELIDARPRLSLAQGALNLTSGLVDEAEEAADNAERALAENGDEAFEPSVGRGASRLANVPGAIAVCRAYAAQLRGDHEATIEFASSAVAELDDSEWMLEGIARMTLAVANWLSGRVDEAEPAMASNIEHWRAVGSRDLTALMSARLGRIQCGQARLDVAFASFQAAREVAMATEGRPLLAIGAANLGIAEVAYQRDDLETALNHATEGIELSRRFVDTQSLASGLAILAWISHALGDAAGADEALDEAGRLAAPAVTDLLNPVPAQRARLHLARGDMKAAADWASQRGLTADDEVNYSQEPAHLVFARLLLAREQPEAALGLLDRLHQRAEAQSRAGSLIEIHVLRAVAMAALGDDENALDALAEALVRGHPHGYIRVFVDEDQPVAALLGQFIASGGPDRGTDSGIPLAYLGRLADAFHRDSPGITGAGTAIQGLVSQLSNREVEVLRLIAAGKPNRDIADELFIAVNTVKRHITHILQKLGATNRTEATARARDLGLIE